MSDIPTPRTNEFAFRDAEVTALEGRRVEDWRQFAKTLERELATAREISQKYEDRYFSTLAERDQLQERLRLATDALLQWERMHIPGCCCAECRKSRTVRAAIKEPA